MNILIFQVLETYLLKISGLKYHFGPLTLPQIHFCPLNYYCSNLIL